MSVNLNSIFLQLIQPILNIRHQVSPFNPRLLSLLLLFYFWANGVSGLDRFPKIHEDESWQAAPGYTFWLEGHFGTDLFAGFYGMEEHYYGFMPLFPIMVGLALHLFGVGLLQARLVPLILITLTLALTHRLGTKLFSPWHGTIAIAVLVGWRIAGSFDHLVSGIPMADIARIVRYDSAVPVFGLSALLILVSVLLPSASQLSIIPSSRPFLYIGFLLGLATLSHLYGAFWLPALLLAMLWILGWQAVRSTLITLVAFALALTPWLIFVISGWSDFLNQSRNYSARFGLFDIRFYGVNLLTEVERYDPLLNGASETIGSWLWFVICGLSLIGLLCFSFGGRLVSFALASHKSKMATQILIICLFTLCTLFALLLSFKTFSYLATLWPLFAVALAAGFIYAWQIQTVWRWWRPLLTLLFLLALAEGAFTNWRMQSLAQQTTPYHTYTQAIADTLPPHSRLMGLQHYWLGLLEKSQDYRSILVPIFWTSPQYVSQPISFAQATEAIPPQVILLDQIMLNFLAETANPTDNLHPLHLQIWAYLEQRQANLIAEFDDPSYGRMQIYQLQTNTP